MTTAYLLLDCGWLADNRTSSSGGS